MIKMQTPVPKILILIFTGLITLHPALSQTPQAREQKARDLTTWLSKGEYEKFYQAFDSMMQANISAEQVSQIWDAIQMQAGAFQKILSVREEKKGNYNHVLTMVAFESVSMEIQYTFNEELQLSGLYFLPPKPPPGYKNPPYDQKDQYKIIDTVLTDPSGNLPAKLLIPVNAPSFPMVVLAHGSGANDMDQSFGPNKPFKDLAIGLASKGVGVLQFDSRALKQPKSIMKLGHKMTAANTTFPDIKNAVALCRKFNGNQGPVILLGLSLGGMMAPRYAFEEEDVDGLIMMAANARPLEDLIIDQYEHLSAKNPALDVEEMKTRVGVVKSDTLSEVIPSNKLPLDLPAAFWMDLKKYDQVAIAKELTIPILILQGERDYQVTMKDFNLWKKGLEGQENVSFQSFETLNHLFLEGTGVSYPEEYNTPGNIPEYVIEVISEWVNKNFAE